MKKKSYAWFAAILLTLMWVSTCWSAGEGTGKGTNLDAVLKGLEGRYQAKAFSARFFQESPLPDIKITERAEGKAFFKRPGKFRWSYEKPDVLDYISDGTRLWIHSPVDNNVWLGTSEDFFGKGGSAAVLTDLKQLRDRFRVSLEAPLSDKAFRLKLLPKEQGQGLTHMFLSVDKSTFDILNIVSFNMNGEETRITFEDMTFTKDLDDTLFTFKIPDNAIVIPLE